MPSRQERGVSARKKMGDLSFSAHWPLFIDATACINRQSTVAKDMAIYQEINDILFHYQK